MTKSAAPIHFTMCMCKDMSTVMSLMCRAHFAFCALNPVDKDLSLQR